VGPGDEVITQANTFHATVAAICQTGAKPVLVDCDADSFLIDVDALDSAISTRTRAIIPVHMYGRATTRIDEIMRLASRRGCVVIEDSAQAHGAKVLGRKTGTFGHVGCFSFHPSKNLAAAGDGGAVVTDDETIADRLRILRNLGQSSPNEHVMIGHNSKLDTVQSLVLQSKLSHLDDWNNARRVIAGRYRDGLNRLPLAFQSSGDAENHVYHLFQILLPNRDELLQSLQSHEIDAVVRYPTPIHLQHAFVRFGWRSGAFPVAEALSRQSICLPIHPSLSDSQLDFVIGVTRTFLESARLAKTKP
jgi:dTDP-4-amino-4,6-dideoxygalactose transaminase